MITVHIEVNPSSKSTYLPRVSLPHLGSRLSGSSIVEIPKRNLTVGSGRRHDDSLPHRYLLVRVDHVQQFVPVLGQHGQRPQTFPRENANPAVPPGADKHLEVLADLQATDAGVFDAYFGGFAQLHGLTVHRKDVDLV